MIILGIDPGMARLGYGIVEIDKNRVRAINFGCLGTRKESEPQKRLLILSQGLDKIITKYKPNCFALEKLFFAKNSKTAFAVGEARGVALLSAAKADIPVCEVTPLQVKNALTGYGLASKHQIQAMVKIIFNLKEIPKPDDAADALAIALTAFRLDKF